MRDSSFSGWQVLVVGVALQLAGCLVQKSQPCDPDPCSGHGACVEHGLNVSCTCDAGYDDATSCQTCAAGYHRAATGDCVADQTCGGVACGDHGTCQITDGVAACVCDAGYAWLTDACVGTCDDPDHDFYGDGPACLGPDNCPNVANFDQADVDNDGVGDVCDTEAMANLVWSPDGSKMAFVRCPPGQTEDCELWVSAFDWSHAAHIYTGVALGGLSDWYGDAILFRADYDIGKPAAYDKSGEFFTIAPDGGNLTQVTFTYTDGIDCHCNSYWEPDGTAVWARFVRGTNKIYFQAHDGNGWHESYLANADGTDGATQVSTGYAWWSGISPTGNVLLYADGTNYDQPMSLYAVPPSGGARVLLASDLAPPVAVAVSPDGSKVAYLGEGATNCDVHVVNVDGTGDTAVLADASQDLLDTFYGDAGLVSYQLPVSPWSPDGQWLVLSSNRNGRSHLFKVHPDGTGLTQLDDGDYYQWAASFSPAGNRIAYDRLAVGYDSSAPLYRLIVTPW